MEQLELFGEDPRIYELPPEKRWAIYTNPTPYQQQLNDEYFKIHKLIQKKRDSAQ
mgnify:CR=1 FL=1